LNADLSAATSELSSEKTRANKLDKQQSGLKQRLREIEELADQGSQAQESAGRAKKIMEEKIEELADIIKDLEADKKALDQRLQAARNDAEEANRLFEEAEASAKKWELEAKQRATDISEMEADLENERDAAKKQRQQLAQKNQELQLQVELGGHGRGGSFGDLKELQDELTRVRKELVEARDVRVAAEKSLNSITLERDDYKSQYEKTEGLASKYLKETRRLTQEYDDAKEKGDTAQAARELLTKTNAEYLSEINQLRSQLSVTIAGGGRAGLETATLVKENSKLKEDYAQLDRKIRVTEIELRELKPTIEDFKYQLEQEKANNLKLAASVKDKDRMLMERELANARLLQGLTDSHSNEKGSLVSEIMELKTKNEELILKNNKLSEDFEMLFDRFNKQARGSGK